jgi:hypothetical protein
MRRNALRVQGLSDDLRTELLNYLTSKDIQEAEFKRPFTIQLDVQSPAGDYWETEDGLCRRINGNGSVIVQSDMTGAEEEVELDKLSVVELAFILDELEEGNFKIY